MVQAPRAQRASSCPERSSGQSLGTPPGPAAVLLAWPHYGQGLSAVPPSLPPVPAGPSLPHHCPGPGSSGSAPTGAGARSRVCRPLAPFLPTPRWSEMVWAGTTGQMHGMTNWGDSWPSYLLSASRAASHTAGRTQSYRGALTQEVVRAHPPQPAQGMGSHAPRHRGLASPWHTKESQPRQETGGLVWSQRRSLRVPH